VRRILWRLYAPFVPLVAWLAKLPFRVGGRPWRAYERQGIVPVPLHYYHPYTREDDPALLRHWDRASKLSGIDIDLPRCLELLGDIGRAYAAECAWPERSDDPHVYHSSNGQFGYASAAVAHAMVRRLGPGRVIEVGSGYSTHVLGHALARNAAESGRSPELISIEPHPPEILNATIPHLGRRIESKVEDVDPGLFSTLGAGDLLFVDSSHVIRYGGDVLFLYLDVLPSLRPGVVVHVHDIHLPDPYPRVYYDESRFVWNEQYLLQAFLCHNDRFRVLLPCWLVHRDHDDRFRRAFPAYDPARHRPGSSMWIERLGSAP
jgi:hypothetical protein